MPGNWLPYAFQIVREVHADHDTGERGVDGHRVGDVVEEVGARVTLDIVGVEVTIAELDVDPVLARRRAIHHVLVLQEIVSQCSNTIIERRTSVTSDGREIFHLYAENSKISAQDEFIV